MTDLVHGNLGTSFVYQRTGLALIGQRIGLTAALVGLATLFAVVITVPLATLAAARKDTIADHAVRGVSVSVSGCRRSGSASCSSRSSRSTCTVLPVGGIGSASGRHLESLILPALTAAFAIVPILVRSLRVGMIEVLDAEFVATARAKGLSEPRVLFSHVARNARDPDGDVARSQHRLPRRQHGHRRTGLRPQRPRLAAARTRSSTATSRWCRRSRSCSATSRRADQPRHRPGRGAPRSADPAAMSTPRTNRRERRIRRVHAGATERLLATGAPQSGVHRGRGHHRAPRTHRDLRTLISPYSPDHQDLYHILSGFSSTHLLGTDQLGRDELSRLLWAARTDLQVGVLAVIFPFCFGTLIGTLTGYFGGWFDAIVMRIVDVVIAFPFYVLRDRTRLRRRGRDERVSTSPSRSSTGSSTRAPFARRRWSCASPTTWPRLEGEGSVTPG